MNNRILKKAAAGIAAFCMVMQIGIAYKTLAADSDVYWSMDFEDTSKSYLNTKSGYDSRLEEIWISEFNYKNLSVEEDESPDINRYLQYFNRNQGIRTTFLRLPDAAGNTVEGQSVIEFDFKFNNTGSGNNQIVLVGDQKKLPGNSVYQESAGIVKLTQNAEDGEFYVNDSDTLRSDGYDGTVWSHAKAVMDFQSKTVILTVASLDGNTTYIDAEQTDMGVDASKLSQIFVMASKDENAVGMDNIIVRKAAAADITWTYYNAVFDVNGKETKTTLREGGAIASVPETDRTGYVFDGWYKDDDRTMVISSETVLRTPLRADVRYTAAYSKDPAYIEPLSQLQFDIFPEEGIAAAGQTPDTEAGNPIGIKLIGELGTDLLKEPDSRVSDLDIEWVFDGFRTIAAINDKTDDVNEDEYCDLYARVVKDPSDPSKVDFRLKKQDFNYYGRVTANVHYNGKDMSVTRAMSVLSDRSSKAGVIIPRRGYISRFDLLEDTMAGYTADSYDENRLEQDIVTGGWTICGGGSGAELYIEKDSGSKFLKLRSEGNGGRSVAVNKLDAFPGGQIIISQDVRFHNANSYISLRNGDIAAGDGEDCISFSYTGTEFILNNGKRIYEASADVWYHVVLSADLKSKLCYAKVYDMAGKSLGDSAVMPIDNADFDSLYLCFGTPDLSRGTLDFNNVTVYAPQAADVNIEIENDSIVIPESGDDSAAVTGLTVSAKTKEGYDITDEAAWTVIGEPEHVTVIPAEDNSHKAVLMVENGAAADEVTVRVSLGGSVKDIPVILSDNRDRISFTKSTQSISIPLDGDTSEHEFAAHVVDKDGVEVEDAEVSLTLYDSSNTEELTSPPEGISFDKDKGILAVSEDAAAVVLYIRAEGAYGNGETVTGAKKVTVHGMAFDLGADGAEAAEGYTKVTPMTIYSDTAGYGIDNGIPISGKETDADGEDTDFLKGSFRFQARVEPNNIYKVTVNYSGDVSSEYVNEDLIGAKLRNETKGEQVYTVPVIDGILDLTFMDAAVSSIVIEKQPVKREREKPNIFTIGDLTASNIGSWAYVMENNLSEYEELSALVSFSNDGREGKNLMSYYNSGEFAGRVLSNIRPNDIVMIGSMGAKGTGDAFAEDLNYYIDACEALGAKIILNSYASHGAVGAYADCYDSSAHTFEGRRNDAYDHIIRSIYAERTDEESDKYDQRIIGFVDIGKMADAAFNAYILDFEANGYADENSAAQAVISCFTGHNSYSGLAAELMISGYGDSGETQGIAEALTQIINDQPEFSVVFDKAERSSESDLITISARVNGVGYFPFTVYIAQYDTVSDTLLRIEKKNITFSDRLNSAEIKYTPVITESAAAAIRVFVWDENFTPHLDDTAV